MPRGREPEGHTALTNAERQARFRARRLALEPPVAMIKRLRPTRRSRAKRWNDALAECKRCGASTLFPVPVP
jgi:hypothetical protein